MLPTPAKLSGPKLPVQRPGAAQLAGAAITKHHRPGGLDSRNVFSSQSWGWKSKAHALAGLVSPGASCQGSQRAVFSLALHMVFSLCLCLDRFFLERHQSYWIQASHLGPHFTLIQSLEALSPNTLTFWDTGGQRFTMNVGPTAQSKPLSPRGSPWRQMKRRKRGASRLCKGFFFP